MNRGVFLPFSGRADQGCPDQSPSLAFDDDIKPPRLNKEAASSTQRKGGSGFELQSFPA